MAHLELSCLGGFVARLDGQAIARFCSGKARALLAYLAVESDRPHPRETLAGLLWPDQSDATARANLRQALTNLLDNAIEASPAGGAVVAAAGSGMLPIPGCSVLSVQVPLKSPPQAKTHRNGAKREIGGHG